MPTNLQSAELWVFLPNRVDLDGRTVERRCKRLWQWVGGMFYQDFPHSKHDPLSFHYC